jgi:hypothetical protein
MSAHQVLPVGTRIIAVRNFGLVQEGAPGIVRGTLKIPFFFWSRLTYLCTFAGNINIAARPNEIDEHDHGYSIEALENPEFALQVLAGEKQRRVDKL